MDFSLSPQFIGHGIGKVFHTLPWVLHTWNEEPEVLRHCFAIEVCNDSLEVNVYKCWVSHRWFIVRIRGVDIPGRMDSEYRGAASDTSLTKVLIFLVELRSKCTSRTYGFGH